MNIRLMGTLEITLNGAAVMPTAPKPRQLLALLALHAGRVVPVASLTEELWGDRPPRTARTILQTYVLQLRELITAALGKGARATGRAGPPRTSWSPSPAAICSTAQAPPSTYGSWSA